MKTIKLYGDSVLTTVCTPYTEEEIKTDLDSIQDVALDMFELIKEYKGLGLSAPQIGVPRRLIVLFPNEKAEPIICINPVLTTFSHDQVLEKEGCMSLPGILLEIPRHSEIAIKYIDIEGKEQEAVLVGMEARIFQHELDHLNGILITRYLSPARLSLIQKRLRDINKFRKLIDEHNRKNPVHTHDRVSRIPESLETESNLVQLGQESEMGPGMGSSDTLSISGTSLETR
ncbi:MAG: peptide deformylase [Candidatus Pacearchaeota archaeon]